MGQATAGGVVAGFVGACRESRRNATPVVHQRQVGDLLSELFHLADRRLERAYVWSRRSDTYRVRIDSSENRFDSESEHWVIVGGYRDGAEHSSALLGASVDDLRTSALEFLARFTPRSKEAATRLPKRLLLGDADATSLEARHPSEFRDPAQALFEKAQSLSESRIVFRGSYIESTRCDQSLLSAAHNQRIHSLRTRGGVMLGAWSGDEIASSHEQASGIGGPELLQISDGQIEAAAAEALSHLHARSSASGEQEVLLNPEASATIAFHAFARAPAALHSDSPLLRIIDDPRVGYGQLQRQDSGQEARVSTLVGTLESTERAPGYLRRDERALLRRMPANVSVVAGSTPSDALISSVKQGVLVQGPLHCALSPDGDRFSLLCSQAREIRDGRFTGRLFARQLVMADRRDFVASTRALGSESKSLAFTSWGMPMSASGAHWLSRARVEAG